MNETGLTALRSGDDRFWGVPRRLAFAATAAFGLLAAAAVFEGLSDGAAALAAAAAFLPLPLYAALALWLDRFEPEPVRALAKCFIWGATVALVFALVVNETALGVASAVLGGMHADLLTSIVVAPVSEEIAKGAALVLVYRHARHDFDGITDGVVYATMVGLGFAAMENVLYYGWAAEAGSLTATFLVRGVLSPFAHPLFTAMLGIGLGLKAERTHRLRWLYPVAGLCAGIVLHALWNLVSVAGLFLPAYALVMVPTFAGVLLLVRRSHRREVALLRDCLRPLSRQGAIPSWVVPLACRDADARRGAPNLPLAARRRIRAAAAALAFAEWRARLHAGGPQAAPHPPRGVLLRRLQAVLREAGLPHDATGAAYSGTGAHRAGSPADMDEESA
jgi:protease PrsW